MREYKPRQAPARFFAGAPEIVRAQVLDFIKIIPAAPLDYDVVLRPESLGEVDDSEMVGLDFDNHGARGCHFFLSRWQMRDYRERNRRKRAAWSDLPPATQQAIVAYLESE